MRHFNTPFSVKITAIATPEANQNTDDQGGRENRVSDGIQALLVEVKRALFQSYCQSFLIFNAFTGEYLIEEIDDLVALSVDLLLELFRPFASLPDSPMQTIGV